MSDKENDLFPVSIDELGKLFFGDESKPLDLGPGRPKKDKENELPVEGLLNSLPDEDEEDENVNEELYPTIEVNDEDNKEKITEKDKQALNKQLRFLKKYEERKKKLEKIQTKFDTEKEENDTIKTKLKEEKLKKKETQIKGASHLVKFLSPANCLYGKDGKIFVTECIHTDSYDGVQANQVVTKCKKCSRIRLWDPQEWESYQQNKH